MSPTYIKTHTSPKIKRITNGDEDVVLLNVSLLCGEKLRLSSPSSCVCRPTGPGRLKLESGRRLQHSAARCLCRLCSFGSKPSKGHLRSPGPLQEDQMVEESPVSVFINALLSPEGRTLDNLGVNRVPRKSPG